MNNRSDDSEIALSIKCGVKWGSHKGTIMGSFSLKVVWLLKQNQFISKYRLIVNYPLILDIQKK